MIAPLAIVGCLVLFFYLPMAAKLAARSIWAVIGLLFYFAYGFRQESTSAAADRRSPRTGHGRSADGPAQARE
ncbi:hypothetical protein ACRAWD_19255 [Caulobacter segnis]